MVSLPCAAKSVDLRAFSGDWYVVRSNSTFWTDKKNVKITYTPASTGLKVTKLHDKVCYEEKGMFGHWKQSHLEGEDEQVGEAEGSLLWTGSGWLRFLSTYWAIVAYDPQYTWAIKYLSPTMMLSEVVDVYSRAPVLDAHSRSVIDTLLASDPFLQIHSANIVDVAHDSHARE